MIARFFAGQFRKPGRLLGRLVGSFMARGNEYEAGWTVSLLNIQPNEHILEIGFGPGVAIQHASQKAVNGLVAGIDFSATMVQVAAKRNAAGLKAGRVDLRQGEVSSPPFPDEGFDKAYTIHCIYFWAKPLDDLRELRRVLKAGGLLAVTIMPADQWSNARPAPPDIFTLYTADEIAHLLLEAGYRDVRVEMCPQPDKFPGACVLAIK
jgi:ubiquinone/menaquinone biosynthesis C-methylase UbiE